jgi:hypothetical protein
MRTQLCVIVPAIQVSPQFCAKLFKVEGRESTAMTLILGHQGDYFWVEIKDDNGTTLIRVGFDHEPTQDEIDDLLQTLSGGDDEVWQP